MGAATIRITDEDFLIPPEFSGLRLATRSAGQIGGVRLELVASGGKTRLGSSYHQMPILVLPPFHFPQEPAALLFLLNPAVGLMDGDGHRLEITARAGSQAVVTGQSASRLHPAQASFATQQWRIRVDDGAELVVLPGPAIPYRGCRYYQKVEIDLAPTAKFIWGDIWLPGRFLHEPDPEQFVFDRLIQDLEVVRTGKSIFRERFAWQGPWDESAQHWHMGKHLASYTLFVTGPVSELPVAERLDRRILSLASGDTCIRCCGSPEDVVWDCARSALGLAPTFSGGSSDRPWLLGANNFAPNHWFSSPPV